MRARRHPAVRRSQNPGVGNDRYSVNIIARLLRRCTFCSITEHEGRITQSRSEDRYCRDRGDPRQDARLHRVISDSGSDGHMYRMACKDPKIESSLPPPVVRVSRRLAKIWGTDHIAAHQSVSQRRGAAGIKKVFVAFRTALRTSRCARRNT